VNDIPQGLSADPAASAEAPGPGPSADPRIDLQLKAFELLLKEAQRAQEKGETERFQTLIEQILAHASQGTSVTIDNAEESVRERRMDYWRIGVTALLVVVLFVTILYTVGVLTSGTTQAAAAQYVTLISSLAGIALGWLFGAGPSTSRRTEVDSSTTSTVPTPGGRGRAGARRRG
jgi:hypothetical protein